VGGELQGDETDEPGDDRIIAPDDPAVFQGKESPGQEGEAPLAGVLRATVSHFFPDFNEWLGILPDCRNQEQIEYARVALYWTALLVLVTKRGARHQIHHAMNGAILRGNFRELCGQESLAKLPHGDTVDYLLKRVDWEKIEGVQVKMVKRLIRRKVLDRYRLRGRYHLVAVDGVEVHRFSYRHCEHCLCVEKDGRKEWFHRKLAAFLVTENGFALPMASVWIENADGKYDKQDCELKAFYRLLPKLRQLYSRLPLCLLLDGLFAGEPTFQKLKEHGLEAILVFKKGKMPEVFDWCMGVLERHGKENILTIRDEKQIPVRAKRTHAERLSRHKPTHQKRTVLKETAYRWMENLQHWDGERSFNILSCHETKDGKEVCHYWWLTTSPVNQQNVCDLAYAGRLRWKGENEGFNVQKNGGYRLEHPYSKDEVSLKCWHQLLQIAHVINQLVEKGSLIALRQFGSVLNFTQQLFEDLKYRVCSLPDPSLRFQIRFDPCPNTS
jgi:hypothetical protein